MEDSINYNIKNLNSTTDSIFPDNNINVNKTVKATYLDIHNTLSAHIHEIDLMQDSIKRIDNEFIETLRPLKILTEEQSTTIINLTEELKESHTSISSLVDSCNNLTESNLKAEYNIQDLKIQLEDKTKECETFKHKMQIYGVLCLFLCVAIIGLFVTIILMQQL